MTANIQRRTEISAPIFVKAEGMLNGKLQIRSLTGDDALCKQVVKFLENNAFRFPFYRDGKGYTYPEAVNTVNLLRGRAEAGNPFSGFAVLNKDHVVGLIRIGFDDDPRKIQIAGMGLEKHQNEGNGQKALHWILAEYLPSLHAKGYRLPVFAEDKTVKEWVDLDKTQVVAVTHPDNEPMVQILEKAGFKCVKEHEIPRFSGVHDGRRKVYEIDLKPFIQSNKSSWNLLERLKSCFNHLKWPSF